MKIGNMEFQIPIFLAPMAGVTDTAYCILAREMGCSLVFSEMVSSMGIHFHNEHTLDMLVTRQEERPVALQLFGADPAIIAEAAQFVESAGCADIIDFNMGCPAPKIVKTGSGADLLRNPELAGKILSSLRKAVKLPITVKMRLGWDENSINVTEIARVAEEAGVDAIAVHGRTRSQFYAGHADWEAIARVKRAVNIPVIANGDIRTCDDLERVIKITGCDGVMIGRAAQGNPWIFKQLKQYFLTGDIVPAPTVEERGNLIMRHLDMLLEYKGDYLGSREMRKHATWYTKGIPGGAWLREQFNRAESRKDFAVIVEKMIEEQSAPGGKFNGKREEG